MKTTLPPPPFLGAYKLVKPGSSLNRRPIKPNKVPPVANKLSPPGLMVARAVTRLFVTLLLGNFAAIPVDYTHTPVPKSLAVRQDYLHRPDTPPLDLPKKVLDPPTLLPTNLNALLGAE